MMKRQWLLLLVPGLLLVGCDDDPYGLEGQFSGQITGAMEFSLSGGAVFAEGESQGQKNFVVEATSMTETDVHKIGIMWAEAPRPEAGVYELGSVPSGLYGMYVRTVNDTATAFFTSVDQAGEVEITKSTSSEVKGTFQFVAEGYTLGEDVPKEITLSGSFTAGRGGVFLHP